MGSISLHAIIKCNVKLISMSMVMRGQTTPQEISRRVRSGNLISEFMDTLVLIQWIDRWSIQWLIIKFKVNTKVKGNSEKQKKEDILKKKTNKSPISVVVWHA